MYRSLSKELEYLDVEVAQSRSTDVRWDIDPLSVCCGLLGRGPWPDQWQVRVLGCVYVCSFSTDLLFLLFFFLSVAFLFLFSSFFQFISFLLFSLFFFLPDLIFPLLSFFFSFSSSSSHLVSSRLSSVYILCII